MPKIINCKQQNFKGMLPEGAQVVIVDVSSFEKAIRVLKDERFQDKPLMAPKSAYDKLITSLTPEQSKVWEEIEREFFVMEL